MTTFEALCLTITRVVPQEENENGKIGQSERRGMFVVVRNNQSLPEFSE